MSKAGWLLDTHAMLWMLYGDRRLSRNARRIIQGSPSLYYSTVSFWEIIVVIEAQVTVLLTALTLRVAEAPRQMDGGKGMAQWPAVCPFR
jgi:PIN domain nuclease of toxin-antitoxin system